MTQLETGVLLAILNSQLLIEEATIKRINQLDVNYDSFVLGMKDVKHKYI